MAAEPLPDAEPLRLARRERTWSAMDAHDLDLLVLGRVANIRYVSGVPILWNAGTRPFGPGCVAVRSTREIYVMSTWDEGVPDEIPHDHLYGITWNPLNLVEVLKGIDAEIGPRRVGTDAMSPLFAQLLPMAFPDADIVDAGPALRAARRVKTDDEIAAVRSSVAVAEAGLSAALAELRVGATERELTGVFMEAMASSGVTTPSTQDVARVTSRGAGGDAIVEGDLVTFHAGVVADGYAGEVGCTRPIGAVDDATASLFDRSEALRNRLLAACRPGAPASDLLDAYAAAGEPLPPTPIAHGLGLGFDDPVIVGDLRRTAENERLDPGVVLLITAVVTDEQVGSITTRDAVVITARGPELLSANPSPYQDEPGDPHG